MKYLNTHYLGLFDSYVNCQYNSSLGMIEPTTNTDQCYVFEDIVSKATTTAIYLKFTIWSSGNIDNGIVLNVRTIKNGTSGNNI